MLRLGEIPVRLKLHSLTGVPRGERGEQHLDGFYFSTDDLLNSRFDAVIMTGTEPRQANLRNEPYWSALTSVLDWAESNTVSTILSCLAAHAGVLHSDGIDRHPLSDKQFGVFDFARAANHQLTAGYGERVRFPHSRWNEVRADELTACGYARADSIKRRRGGFVREEQKAQPVCAFPGPSGIWRADSAEGIPERYKKISQSGERNVSLDAEGVF